MKRAGLLCAVLFALQIPWLLRPVDVDEANFLGLARGAAVDFARPHDIRINWSGTTERAFDVLSNPPGIAWWLAPVASQPVWVQRVWMLPWILLAVFGARRLGRRFGVGDETATVLLAAPIALISWPSLMPDGPLYACTLAGVGGFVDAIDRRRPAAGWALLAGCAALFRYSGVTLMPLLALYALLHRRRPWAALAAWVPIGLLGVHDELVYGAWHLIAMTKFQSTSNSLFGWTHKGVAALAMLGGAAALPLFRWRWSALAGAVVGALAGSIFGVTEAIFVAAGGASLASAVAFWTRDPVQRRDRLWLAAWAGGGWLFLLTLRFVATRYWLAFLPGVLLALPLGRWRRVWIAASVLLGLALAADGELQARSSQLLADHVAALGTGTFTGHWGWQWELEAKGWRALEAGERPPRNSLVAIPRQAWPQRADVTCPQVVWQGSAKPPFLWLPRGYSEEGRANIHGNWIAGPPMLPTVLPWTFASDAYEQVVLCREAATLPSPGASSLTQ